MGNVTTNRGRLVAVLHLLRVMVRGADRHMKWEVYADDKTGDLTFYTGEVGEHARYRLNVVNQAVLLAVLSRTPDAPVD